MEERRHLNAQILQVKSDDFSQANESTNSQKVSDLHKGGLKKQSSSPRIETDLDYFADNSLFIFSVDNKLRKAVQRLVSTNIFAWSINVIIILNSIFLIFETIDSMRVVNTYSNIIFTCIFTAECVLKIIAYGFVLEEHTYLRDPWNWLDFIIVVLGLISFLPEIDANILALRTFRLIRPLKTISMLPNMRNFITTLINSLVDLSSVFMLLLFFFFIFAILGLSLWADRFEYLCRTSPTPVSGTVPIDPNFSSRLCGGEVTCNNNTDMCISSKLIYDNATYFMNPQVSLQEETYTKELYYRLANFENILNSLFVVFMTTTCEGWTKVMYIMMDGHNYFFSLFYFCLCVIINYFFLLNLTVAVLLYNFERSRKLDIQFVKKDQQESKEKDEEMGQEISKKRKFVFMEIVKNNKFSSLNVQNLNDEAVRKKYRRKYVPIKDTDTNRAADVKNLRNMVHRLVKTQCFENVKRTSEYHQKFLPGYLCYYLYKQPFMQYFFYACIIINSIILTLDRIDQTDIEFQVIEKLNIFLVSIFVFEMFIMLLGLGLLKFARDYMNIWDLLVVIVSLIELVITKNFQDNNNARTGSSASIASIFRMMRILRVFKLFRAWQNFQVIMESIKETLVRMTDYLLLFLLFLYMYSLLGYSFFNQSLKFDKVTNQYSDSAPSTNYNFDDFPNSLITVFQIIIGDNWFYFFFDCFRSEKNNNFATVIYFITLVLFGQITMMNIFLAYLIDNFERARRHLHKNIKVRKFMLNVIYYCSKSHELEKIDYDSLNSKNTVVSIFNYYLQKLQNKKLLAEGLFLIRAKSELDFFFYKKRKSEFYNSGKNKKAPINKNERIIFFDTWFTNLTKEYENVNNAKFWEFDLMYDDEITMKKSWKKKTEKKKCQFANKELEQIPERLSKMKNTMLHKSRLNLNSVLYQEDIIPTEAEPLTPLSDKNTKIPTKETQFKTFTFPVKTISANSLGHNEEYDHAVKPAMHDEQLPADIDKSLNFSEERVSTPNIPGITPATKGQRMSIQNQCITSSVGSKDEKKCGAFFLKINKAKTILRRKVTYSDKLVIEEAHSKLKKTKSIICELSRKAECVEDDNVFNKSFDQNENVPNHHHLKLNSKLSFYQRESRSNSVPKKRATRIEFTKTGESLIPEKRHNEESKKIQEDGDNLTCCQKIGKKLEPVWEHLTHSSLGIFHKNWAIRRFATRVVYAKVFDYVIFLTIMANCICLCLDNPWVMPGSWEERALDILNYIFNSIFIIEGVLKIISDGFLFRSHDQVTLQSSQTNVLLHGAEEMLREIRTSKDLLDVSKLSEEEKVKEIMKVLKKVGSKSAYLRKLTNIIDFFCILIGLLDICGGLSGIRFLRTLRVLRSIKPIRLITKNDNLKIIVSCLVKSIPAMGNVLLVSGLFIFIYALVGVSIFKRDLNSYCTIEEFSNETDCISNGGLWLYNFENFSNFFFSLKANFELIMVEGWGRLMYIAGQNLNCKWVYLYFISYILIGSLFIINLFVSIVITKFKLLKGKENKFSGLSDPEKEWIRVQKIMMKFRPVPKFVMKNSSKCKKVLFDFIESPKFETLITVFILLSMITLVMQYNGSGEVYDTVLEAGNYFFTFAFNVELCCKIIIYGKMFFFSRWNLFDFVIILLCNIMVIINSLAYGGVIHMSQSLSALPIILRSFRILRIFRLLTVYSKLRALIDTLVYLVPSVVNVGIVMMILILIYGNIGMNIFGTVPFRDKIHHNNNFKNFLSSALLLFRATTGEDWNDMMNELAYHDCRNASSPTYLNDYYCVGFNLTCYDDELVNYTSLNNGIYSCGNNFSYFYFMTFMILGPVFIMNLCIVMVIEGFSESMYENEGMLSQDYMDKFLSVWMNYDPNCNKLVRPHEFVLILKELHPPLGFNYDRHHVNDPLKMNNERLKYLLFKNFIENNQKENKAEAEAMLKSNENLPNTTRKLSQSQLQTQTRFEYDEEFIRSAYKQLPHAYEFKNFYLSKNKKFHTTDLEVMKLADKLQLSAYEEVGTNKKIFSYTFTNRSLAKKETVISSSSEPEKELFVHFVDACLGLSRFIVSKAENISLTKLRQNVVGSYTKKMWVGQYDNIEACFGNRKAKESNQLSEKLASKIMLRAKSLFTKKLKQARARIKARKLLVQGEAGESGENIEAKDEEIEINNLTIPSNAVPNIPPQEVEALRNMKTFALSQMPNIQEDFKKRSGRRVTAINWMNKLSKNIREKKIECAKSILQTTHKNISFKCPTDGKNDELFYTTEDLHIVENDKEVSMTDEINKIFEV